MKIVYIAHPVKGYVRANIKKVIKITRQIARKEPQTMPIAPYVLYNLALNDRIQADRFMGISFNNYYFVKHFIDELRLYGDRISQGMFEEIKLTTELDIPVVACTKGTKKELKELIHNGQITLL